jgi:hypothetical protein
VSKKLTPTLAGLAARIRREHEATAAALRKGAQHALAAGKVLIEAKAQIKHGGWTKWLADECGLKPRTASLYMWLAEREDQIGNVADLSLREAVKHIKQEDRLNGGFIVPRPDYLRADYRPGEQANGKTRKAKPAPTIDEERDPERFEQLDLPTDDPEASGAAMKAKFAALEAEENGEPARASAEPDTKESGTARDPRLAAEWTRFRRLWKPLTHASDYDLVGSVIGLNLFDVDEIDEALGKIEKHVEAWNALAEHLKAVRVKAASLEPAKAAAA